jgi:hypothetical protein
LDGQRDEEANELEAKDDGQDGEDAKPEKDVWPRPSPCCPLLRQENAR